MGLIITNKKVTSKLYDKRDAFNFSVVRLPYKCSNIPSKVFYATIGAEVLRIGKATPSYDSFLQSVQTLLLRMKNQGAYEDGIKRVLRKMLGRHQEHVLKFAKPSDQLVLDCCS